MNHDTQAIQPERRTVEVQGQDGCHAGESSKGQRENSPAKKIKEGQVFGQLTALRSVDELRWEFLCQCGNKKPISKHSVLKGFTRSCGCLRKASLSKIATTHGMSTTPEYRIWAAMIRRCHSEQDKAYPNYGGRGITVCDEWRKSFARFINDVGKRLNPSLSIHRIDNDLGYSPANCKWVTSHEQALFKRNTKRHEFNGQNLTLREWSELLKLPANMLYQRINKLGWSYERAFSTPNIGRFANPLTEP